MAATKGNRFWEARSSHGRKKKWEDPQEFLEACSQWFEWVEQNPLMSSELVTYQGEGSIIEVPKMRAMTIDGICVWLGITRETWCQYRKREDLSDVIDYVDGVMKNQKVAGAAAGLLNANIIAREVGLRDTQEVDHTSSDGSMSPKGLADFYADVNKGDNDD